MLAYVAYGVVNVRLWSQTKEKRTPQHAADQTSRMSDFAMASAPGRKLIVATATHSDVRVPFR
jgi:hypothetical protein